jgi:tetratricopeptide (TPR) repeat protein
MSPFYFFQILMFLLNWRPFSNTTDNNLLKNQIMVAFNQKKISKSEILLKQLIKNIKEEPEIPGNIGIVLYNQKKYTEAKIVFEKLQNSTNIQVASEADLHLGFIKCIESDSANAIVYFENALKIDNNNKLARYNLELIKKKFEYKREEKNNETPKQKEIEKNKIQNIIIDPLSEKEQSLARLGKINLTESQAKNIFDAINTEETKYLKQRKNKAEKSNGNYKNW